MHAASINYVKAGSGKPLLLVHGEGGSLNTWNLVMDSLGEEREVIAIDLPGFGASEPLAGPVSIDSLSDSVADFIVQHHLEGVDMVGSSAGGCIALELARRGGLLGTSIALNPPGFWKEWQRRYYQYSMNVLANMVQYFKMPVYALMKSTLARKLLLLQFSHNPLKLPHKFLVNEMDSLIAAPSFDKLVNTIAYSNIHKGIPKTPGVQPVVIGWGRNDRLCPPVQASHAQQIYPGASMFWFSKCGHFPQWDTPAELVRLVLGVTS